MKKEEIIANKTKISLVTGDITRQDTEAIVNAANSSLMGGGGVDGAIHSAGGPQILEECKEIVKKIGKLPAGDAVITSGGNLSAKYVIHTVGPVWRDGKHDEETVLTNAYINSLKKAAENKIKSISFPSISTGAYSFPTKKAAEIALSTIINYIKSEDFFDEIRVVLWTRVDYEIYNLVLIKLMEKNQQFR